MAGIIGVLTIGILVVVLLIAIFSLLVLIIIPIGKYLERRNDAADQDPSSGS